MKIWFSDTDEFYVGYTPQAPQGISNVMRKVIFFLLASGILIGFMLAWHQKEFSSAHFEYGNATTIEGYFFNDPTPHLLLPLGKNPNAEELYQTVLLVGEGKAGADSTIRRLSKTTTENLVGAKISLSG